MNKKVLLVHGMIGSGKDSLTTSLVGHYNEHKAVKLAFADELKQVAHKYFGIPLEWLFGSQEDKNRKTAIKKLIFGFPELKIDEYYTVREFICALSDEFKKYDKYCWCRPISSFIQSCLVSPGNCQGWQKNLDYFFISDFRFPFEKTYLLDNIKDIEIKTLKLLRDGETNDHNSENSLKDYEFDWVIDNRELAPSETFAEALKLLNQWETENKV